MTLHDRNHPVCSMMWSMQFKDRLDPVPQLYFPENTNIYLKDESITNVYRIGHGKTLDSKARLNISVATYDRNGHLVNFDESATASLFQFCNGSYNELNAAFNFGVRYQKSCQIPSQAFMQQAKSQDGPRFYDMYVPFEGVGGATEFGNRKLYAIPMRIMNHVENQNKDLNNWRLTSRFFMLDALSGSSVAAKQAAKDDDEPVIAEMFRYAKRISIKVTALNTRQYPEKAGRIYPPLVSIEYEDVTLEEVEAGNSFDFEFVVEYDMEIWETEKELEVGVYYSQTRINYLKGVIRKKN